MQPADDSKIHDTKIFSAVSYTMQRMRKRL